MCKAAERDFLTVPKPNASLDGKPEWAWVGLKVSNARSGLYAEKSELSPSIYGT